jgi:hypothetical protein
MDVLQCRLVSRDETDAIALTSEPMGDRAANSGGSAGDDDGAGRMLHAAHRDLSMSFVEFMRSDRFDVDHGHMAVRPAIFARDPCNDRQLHHGSPLPRVEVREQDDLAVRKFDGVMMRRRVLRVHLPETREPPTGSPFLEQTKERSTPLDFIFKRKLGAWQQANRNSRLIDGSKAAGGGAREGRCYQTVAGFGGARRD